MNEVKQLGEMIGFDPKFDWDQYSWFMRVILSAPLPQHWEREIDPEANVLYHNTQTGTLTYTHPMNQFFTRFVRERGCRHALGLADGVSWTDELLWTVPELEGTLVLTEPALQDLSGVKHVITGKPIHAQRDDQDRPTLDLPPAAAFQVLRD